MLSNNPNIIFSYNKAIVTVKHPKLPQFRLVKVVGGNGIIEKLDKKTKVASFYMAEYQVTQELYQAVMGKNPSEFKGKRRPVENVSWYDSVNFCQQLNDILKLPQPITGKKDTAQLDINKAGFRLPTEAEWEYAARGGHLIDKQQAKTLQYAGSKHLHQVGWYDGNNNFETRPVGLKKNNEIGLYDMNGNVYEWCCNYDCNRKYLKILRGGSWNTFTHHTNTSYYIVSNGRSNSYGFRIVLSISL